MSFALRARARESTDEAETSSQQATRPYILLSSRISVRSLGPAGGRAQDARKVRAGLPFVQAASPTPQHSDRTFTAVGVTLVRTV